MNLIGYLTVAVLLDAGSVSCQPEHCYFCNTEVHGQGCQDPIIPEQLQVQRCSDSELVVIDETKSELSSYMTKMWNFFKGYNVLSNTATTDTNTDVCIYMTYVLSINGTTRNVSSRGCEKASKNTNMGVLDICTYYNAIYPFNRISNLACTACSSNLCNHANFTENIPSGPDSPSSSNIISVYFVLIATLLLSNIVFI